MFTNSEFSVHSNIKTPIVGDMELFAMFTIDLGDVKTTIGRDANGKRIVRDANPHLVGKGVNLWDVTPITDTATPAEMRKATEVERILQEKGAKIERESRIAAYAKRVAEELPLFESIEEAELEGFEKFMALDVEMRGGRCTRKGGVRSNSGFENFVDSAQ